MQRPHRVDRPGPPPGRHRPADHHGDRGLAGHAPGVGRHQSRSPWLFSIRSVSSSRALPPALSSPSRAPSSSIWPGAGPGRRGDQVRHRDRETGSSRRGRARPRGLLLDEPGDRAGRVSTTSRLASRLTSPRSSSGAQRLAARSLGCCRARSPRSAARSAPDSGSSLLVRALLLGGQPQRASRPTRDGAVAGHDGMLVPPAFREPGGTDRTVGPCEATSRRLTRSGVRHRRPTQSGMSRGAATRAPESPQGTTPALVPCPFAGCASRLRFLLPLRLASPAATSRRRHPWHEAVRPPCRRRQRPHRLGDPRRRRRHPARRRGNRVITCASGASPSGPSTWATCASSSPCTSSPRSCAAAGCRCGTCTCGTTTTASARCRRASTRRGPSTSAAR